MELSRDQQMIYNKQRGKALSVSAASVNELSAKLLKDGLISHIPYQGVQITEKGPLIADQMSFNWDEVHNEEEMLEHVSSNRLSNSLDTYLGFPKYDPHGGVIPDKEERIEVSESKPFIELEVGIRFVIREVDGNQKFLAYLFNKDVKTKRALSVDKR